MRSRAFDRIAAISSFTAAAVLAITAARAEPPVPAAALPQGLPAEAAVPATALPQGLPAGAAVPAPALPQGLPVGAPGPVVLEAGALPFPPLPPPLAFVYWPMCGDSPCPRGGSGVWVHYPAALPPGVSPAELPSGVPGPAIESRGTGMRSPQLMAAGVATMALSSVEMMVGLAVGANRSDKAFLTAALVIGVAGVSMGLPLVVIGGLRNRAPRPGSTPWAAPQVGLGIGAAQLTWQF